MGILGLIAFAFIIWFGLDYIRFGSDNFQISAAYRLVIILVGVTLWALYQWWSQIQSNRSNDNLIEELNKSPENTTNETSAREYQQLKGRFQDALAKLQNTKFGSYGNRMSLYQLPWYIVIGPPGAGKTTAISNSGLEFPLSDIVGRQSVGGVGGTRNCDWWFTNEAVLIDTAGRYTTQDSHRDVDNRAWHDFLKLLKKYRSRQPINGAIVTVSTQDLLLFSDTQRQEHANAIRERIDELHSQLGIDFPIYLLFTKCDLISGFNQFFAEFRQHERQQIWGATLPIKLSGDVLSFFETEFDSLVGRLNDNKLVTLSRERELNNRASVVNFASQFAQLKQPIREFIKIAFSENQYRNQRNLRGFYFASGTQEGTPIDKMVSMVSREFGLGRQASQPMMSTGKSFFIYQLFQDLIFKESLLAGRNSRKERFFLGLKFFGLISFAVMMFGAVSTWVGSLAQNKYYMSAVSGHIEDYKQVLKSPNADRGLLGDASIRLDSLQKASSVYDKESHPWLNSLGLYDQSVDKSADQLYQNALQADLLPTLKRYAEGQLNVDNDVPLFDTLKVYLMFADKNRRDTEFMKGWFENEISRQYANDAPVKASLNKHISDLFALDFESEEIDFELANRLQNRLGGKSSDELIYDAIKYEYYGRYLDVSSSIDTNANRLFTANSISQFKKIPYLFSRDAMSNIDFSVNSAPFDKITKDRWVLGQKFASSEPTPDELNAISQRVQNQYFSEYFSFWKNLVAKLEVKIVNSLQDASDQTAMVANMGNSPITEVIRVVHANTAISSRLSLKASDYSLPSDLAQLTSMVGDGNQYGSIANQLSQQVSSLNIDLSGVKGSVEVNREAFNAVVGYLNNLKLRSLEKVFSLSRQLPRPAERWMKTIAQNVWRQLVDSGQTHLRQTWRVSVKRQCEANFEQRYPFWNNGKDDVSLDAFSDYFAYGGIEESFFAENLTGLFDGKGIKSRHGYTLSLSANFVTNRNYARQIREFFFETSEYMPKATYEMIPEKLDARVANAELNLGNGVVYRYSHGPRFKQTYVWNGTSNDGVSITFEDITGTQSQYQERGTWAWFRLLDKYALRDDKSYGGAKIIFDTNGRSMTYSLSMTSKLDTLQYRIMQQYRCVDL